MMSDATQQIFILQFAVFMAKLHVIGRLGVSASIALCTVYATAFNPMQTYKKKKNSLINIQDGPCLREPNFNNKLHENACNVFHLRNLKQIKVKGITRWRQSGSYYQKCHLLEQHTSHLYIYIKENHYLHWIFDIFFTCGYVGEKEKKNIQTEKQFQFTNCVGSIE